MFNGGIMGFKRKKEVTRGWNEVYFCLKSSQPKFKVPCTKEKTQNGPQEVYYPHEIIGCPL